MQVGWVILNGSCMRSSPWECRRACRRGGPRRPETSAHTQQWPRCGEKKAPMKGAMRGRE
ncbi:hypothetical protein DEM28_25265 [Enterobacter mori]|nr:hypothetical protein DEM28_25265 [Enterobacter mori]